MVHWTNPRELSRVRALSVVATGIDRHPEEVLMELQHARFMEQIDWT
jgi:hypothetical protein